MEFTFENKLNHIFWEPIGPCLLEEPGNFGNPGNPPKNPDQKLDQRRASTTHYKQHRDAIIDLVQFRDRAKAVGLDEKFRAIVRSIVPGGLKAGDDLTRRNVFSIEMAMSDPFGASGTSFKDDVEAKERELDIEVEDGSNRTLDAIRVLRASAPLDATGGHTGATPSFATLINPYGDRHDAKKPLKIQYYAGPDLRQKKYFVLDNNRKLYSQYEEFIAIIVEVAGFVPAQMRQDYQDLMFGLRPGGMGGKGLHDARFTLIKAHMPDIGDEQAQYTATFYTLRNAALAFESLERDRKKLFGETQTAQQQAAKRVARAKKKAANELATKTKVGATQPKGKVKTPKGASASDVSEALDDLLGI